MCGVGCSILAWRCEVEIREGNRYRNSGISARKCSGVGRLGEWSPVAATDWERNEFFVGSSAKGGCDYGIEVSRRRESGSTGEELEGVCGFWLQVRRNGRALYDVKGVANFGFWRRNRGERRRISAWVVFGFRLCEKQSKWDFSLREGVNREGELAVWRNEKR